MNRLLYAAVACLALATLSGPAFASDGAVKAKIDCYSQPQTIVLQNLSTHPVTIQAIGSMTSEAATFKVNTVIGSGEWAFYSAGGATPGIGNHVLSYHPIFSRNMSKKQQEGVWFSSRLGVMKAPCSTSGRFVRFSARQHTPSHLGNNGGGGAAAAGAMRVVAGALPVLCGLSFLMLTLYTARRCV